MEAPPDDREILTALDRHLTAATVWLYGSAARDSLRPHSDLDLAVLLAQPADRAEVLAVSGLLEAELGRTVDLVDLDAAGPVLAHQVIRDGRLLRDDAPNRRVALAVRTATAREDLRISQRSARAIVAKRLQGAA